jgi:hypothetical protein
VTATPTTPSDSSPPTETSDSAASDGDSLERGQLGLFGVIMPGVAQIAPAFNLFFTTGLIVALAGASAPAASAKSRGPFACRIHWSEASLRMGTPAGAIRAAGGDEPSRTTSKPQVNTRTLKTLSRCS